MRKICVSFSGGKTSAYMADFIRRSCPDDKIVYVFANTGEEHQKTYEFIEQCSQHFDIEIITVEAVIPERGKSSYRTVPLNKCSRDGSLFESVVKRYGITNQGFPSCTRELKTQPIHAFCKDYFGGVDYETAIGIRADEIDRVNPNFDKRRLWYPLAWNGISKEIINEFWRDQPFTLEIPGYLGNCVWCWKKAFSKHMKIIKEIPEAYDVPKRLEAKYKINDIPSQPKRYMQRQVFFRKHLSASDLFDEYHNNHLAQLSLFDLDTNYENSCAESCEIYPEALSSQKMKESSSFEDRLDAPSYFRRSRRSASVTDKPSLLVEVPTPGE